MTSEDAIIDTLLAISSISGGKLCASISTIARYGFSKHMINNVLRVLASYGLLEPKNNDIICFEPRRYNVLRKISMLVKRGFSLKDAVRVVAVRETTHRIDAKELVNTYIEYLRRHGWLRDWLRWGGHSVNLYELWEEFFRDKIPWEEFKKQVREIASRTLGIEYTYYFIYDDKRAHSINISTEAARSLGINIARKRDNILVNT